jgi:hypothetical protein
LVDIEPHLANGIFSNRKNNWCELRSSLEEEEEEEEEEVYMMLDSHLSINPTHTTSTLKMTKRKVLCLKLTHL